MKILKYILAILLPTIIVVSIGQAQTIQQLPQFVSTTSPASAITQQIINKALRLTGLSNCTVVASSNGTLGCITGGGATSTHPFMASWFVATSTSNASTFPYASTTAISSTGSAWFATDGGNVGIGTTTPAGKLHVYTTGVSSTLTNASVFENGNATGISSGQVILKSTSSGYASGLLFQSTETGTDTDILQASIEAEGSSNWSSVGSASSFLRFSTTNAGTIAERMRITAAGNVGIGSTSPAYKLVVSGGQVNIDNNQALRFNSTAGASLAGMFINTSNILEVGTTDSALDGILFKPGAGEAMRITDAGNVGIGDTGPDAKFEVSDATNGSVYPIRITSTDGGWSANQELGIDFTQSDTVIGRISNFLNSSSDHWGFNFYGYNTSGGFNTAPIVSMQGNGNVGMGTASPETPLQVTAQSGVTSVLRLTTNDYSINTTGSKLNINFGAASGNTYTAINATDVGGNSTADLIFQNGGGNVGIGTTGPGAKLHIENNTAANIGQYIVNTSASAGAAEIIYLSEETSPATKALSIFHTNAGYADTGIVGPSGGYIDSFDTNGLWLGSRNAAGEVHLFTGGTGASNERMTITSGGNVGIGTTTPMSLIEGETVVLTIGGSSLPVVTLKSTASAQETALASNGAGIYLDIAGHATASNNDIVFRTGNTASSYSVTERMRINNDGYIGIGTTTPASLLHVSAGASATTTVEFGARSITAKTCFNVRNTTGATTSFYFVGTTMVVEANACR